MDKTLMLKALKLVLNETMAVLKGKIEDKEVTMAESLAMSERAFGTGVAKEIPRVAGEIITVQNQADERMDLNQPLFPVGAVGAKGRGVVWPVASAGEER